MERIEIRSKWSSRDDRLTPAEHSARIGGLALSYVPLTSPGQIHLAGAFHCREFIRLVPSKVRNSFGILTDATTFKRRFVDARSSASRSMAVTTSESLIMADKARIWAARSRQCLESLTRDSVIEWFHVNSQSNANSRNGFPRLVRRQIDLNATCVATGTVCLFHITDMTDGSQSGVP
jgi:hypothetical protein